MVSLSEQLRSPGPGASRNSPHPGLPSPRVARASAPPSPHGGGKTATVAMIVMEPAAGVMEVAMLPALNRNFQRFTLAMADEQSPPRR